MSKETSVMVQNSGVSVGPEGLQLDGLSARKQKQAALEFILDSQRSIADLTCSVERKKELAKIINEQLAKLEPTKRLRALRKEMTEETKLSQELASRYMGALGIIKALGIDLSRELKNVRMIENE